MYFPHPLTATEDGLLAVGGDLSPERLLFAYQNGIFPWYNVPPILWWYTSPRCVLFPSQLRVSKSMRKLVKSSAFEVTTNKAFVRVVEQCSYIKRKGQESTWISEDMKVAYINLNKRNYAHSIEVWNGDELVGGLYGVAIGKIFFGESMFSLRSNASKYGLIHLVEILRSRGIWLIDCQQKTDHMISLGASMISGTEFWKFITQNRFEEQVELF